MLHEFAQADALVALGKDEEALIGHLHDLVYGRARSHRMQVGPGWRVQTGIALRHHEDGLLFPK